MVRSGEEEEEVVVVRKKEGLRPVGLMRARLKKGEGRGIGGLFLLPSLD